MFQPMPSAADIGACWPSPSTAPGGSKINLVVRIFVNVPAPTNPVLYRYHFASDSRLFIDVNPGPSIRRTNTSEGTGP